MAITQNTFTGNGSNLGPFTFTFKWLESTDVKVTVNGVLKTAGTHYNLQALNYTTKDGGQVLFTAGNAPAANTVIRIYRDTDDSALPATFFSGSAIRSQDLNDDFTQNLYSTQEVKARYLDRQSGEMEAVYVPATSTSVVTKGYMETNYGIIDEVGFTRWRQVATSGQTAFSGAGSYGNILSFVPTREQVYLNGALQQINVDYTTNTAGTTITFSPGLTAGDVVDVVCINNLVQNSTTNSDDLDFVQAGTGAVTRSVGSKLRDIVSVKDFGAVADCTGQGIGTDVIPAILAAVNYAVTLGPGTKVVLPPGRYRASTSAVLDLTGKSFIQLDFQGSITPDSTAMTVLTIQNGRFLELTASIEKGGIFNGFLDPNPYGPCNYSTTRDAAAAGGQEMFLIRGVSNYTVDLKASAYAGRVLRTDERTNVAHPPTIAIKGKIRTERTTDLSIARTAQSLWADGGTAAPNSGNWGSLDRLVSDFDYYGPVWSRLNDIDIGIIDAAYVGAGPTFYGCQVVTGHTWYVGDTDGGAGSRHIQFLSKDGIDCSFINVALMRFLNKGPGLWMENVFKAEFSADTLGTNFGDVCTLSNCNDIAASISAFGTGSRLLNITGALTNFLDISVTAPDATLSEDVVLIDSTVTQSIKLYPTITVRGAGKAAIKVNGSAQLQVINPVLSGIAGTSIFNISSAANNVNLFNGYVNTGSVTVFTGNIKPVCIYGTRGLDDQVLNHNIRTNSGGNTVGDGGAFQVGIASSGLQQYSPMAQVKGKLVNSAGTELQGNLALQIRPNGVAGQTLLDAFTASDTTTDGEMLAVILARIAGAYVAKRVKVGNINTGPGGVGRALYVDN